jgi:hypothetical protein
MRRARGTGEAKWQGCRAQRLQLSRLRQVAILICGRRYFHESNRGEITENPPHFVSHRKTNPGKIEVLHALAWNLILPPPQAAQQQGLAGKSTNERLLVRLIGMKKN